MKYVKVFVLIFMFILSIATAFEQNQKYISYDTYIEGLDNIDEDYRDTGLLTPPIEEYLSRHYEVDGEYIRVSYNWMEGTLYFLGTLMIAGVVMKDEFKRKQ